VLEAAATKSGTVVATIKPTFTSKSRAMLATAAISSNTVDMFIGEATMVIKMEMDNKADMDRTVPEINTIITIDL